MAGMPIVPLIARSRLKNDPTSLGVVTDPGDELLGLSQMTSRSLRMKPRTANTRRKRKRTGHIEIPPRAC